MASQSLNNILLQATRTPNIDANRVQALLNRNDVEAVKQFIRDYNRESKPYVYKLANNNHTRIISHLINHVGTEELFQPTQSGDTSFHIAASESNIRILNCLIQSTKSTPFHKSLTFKEKSNGDTCLDLVKQGRCFTAILNSLEVGDQVKLVRKRYDLWKNWKSKFQKNLKYFSIAIVCAIMAIIAAGMGNPSIAMLLMIAMAGAFWICNDQHQRDYEREVEPFHKLVAAYLNALKDDFAKVYMTCEFQKRVPNLQISLENVDWRKAMTARRRRQCWVSRGNDTVLHAVARTGKLNWIVRALNSLPANERYDKLEEENNSGITVGMLLKKHSKDFFKWMIDQRPFYYFPRAPTCFIFYTSSDSLPEKHLGKLCKALERLHIQPEVKQNLTCDEMIQVIQQTEDSSLMTGLLVIVITEGNNSTITPRHDSSRRFEVKKILEAMDHFPDKPKMLILQASYEGMVNLYQPVDDDNDDGDENLDIGAIGHREATDRGEHGVQQYSLKGGHFFVMSVTVLSDTPPDLHMISIFTQILKKLKAGQSMDEIFRKICHRVAQRTETCVPVLASSNNAEHKICLGNVFNGG